MAIAQFKLARLEANLSGSFYQSKLMLVTACEDSYKAENGAIRPPDVISAHEQKAHSLINGLSQHIARVERAWFNAMETLQLLQERREKRALRQPVSSTESLSMDSSLPLHLNDSRPSPQLRSQQIPARRSRRLAFSPEA